MGPGLQEGDPRKGPCPGLLRACAISNITIVIRLAPVCVAIPLDMPPSRSLVFSLSLLFAPCLSLPPVSSARSVCVEPAPRASSCRVAFDDGRIGDGKAGEHDHTGRHSIGTG